MDISLVRVIFIFLFLFLTYLESAGPEFLQQFSGKTLFTAVGVGLILGEVELGMTIGATMQLMALGLADYGGASIPDYPMGAAVGVMIAYMSGTTLEAALPVAIAVAMLGSQIATFMRTLMIYFNRRSQLALEKGNIKSAYRWPMIGLVCSGIMRYIPIFLLYFLGASKVSDLVTAIPDSIMGSLNVMSGLMPALGMAILLRYMNVRKYFPYLIMGFGMAAILQMPVLSVAIFGFAFAAIVYMSSEKDTRGGVLDDEV